MNIFNFFIKEKEEKQKKFQDNRKAICPYCNKDLKKIPGAKTKCPHCGRYMYVRTTVDNIRMVVTEEKADNIDEDWRIYEGTQEIFIENQKKFDERKRMLYKKFGGQEPSENDIHWSLLNEDLLTQMQSGNWGLYRCTKFKMAEILRKEKKLKHALQAYMEVCFLDLNGPNNTSGLVDILKPFDPSGGNAFLAPGVIDLMKIIIKKLGLSLSDVKELFFERMLKIAKTNRFPVSVEDCWEKIGDEL